MPQLKSYLFFLFYAFQIKLCLLSSWSYSNPLFCFCFFTPLKYWNWLKTQCYGYLWGLLQHWCERQTDSSEVWYQHKLTGLSFWGDTNTSDSTCSVFVYITTHCVIFPSDETYSNWFSLLIHSSDTLYHLQSVAFWKSNISHFTHRDTCSWFHPSLPGSDMSASRGKVYIYLYAVVSQWRAF